MEAEEQREEELRKGRREELRKEHEFRMRHEEELRKRREEELRKRREEESRKRHEEELLRKKKGRKKRTKAKQREKEKQRLSGPSVQHEALVIQESSTALEQQQHKTSGLSPDPSLTRDHSADLQDAGEALSDKVQGKHVGHKAQEGVPGSAQEAVTYASPPREEESIKQNDDAILKEGYPNDAELLMVQSVLHASHSSDRSGEAQQEASFDWDETSSRLKVDKKPMSSCSRDCSKTAQDVDEQCDKKPSSLDEDEHSDKNPPLDEDEFSDENPWDEDEHSDKFGVHAIEDQSEEQGRAVSHAQALLDMDNDTIEEKVYDLFSQLKYDGPEDPFYWSLYEPQQLPELHQRLALYRIKGYDYEVCVDRKFAGMDHEKIAEHYPPDILSEEGYFEHYEDSLEWYFDYELHKYAGFDDYQRLVLRNDGEYRDWNRYKSTFHTYEIDLAYVQYYKAMENVTKWMEDCMVDGSIPWEKIENVACLQLMKIAAGFPNLRPRLLSSGFQEYMWKVRANFKDYKGLDGVYFEIWKRVTKEQMDFTEALSEVYRETIFPYRRFEIEQELENSSQMWSMKDKYDSYVACIGDLISDDQALQLITEAVKKMTPDIKIYADYAKKKLEIADEIGLTPNGRTTEVAGQWQGDTGEAMVKINN